MPRPLVLGNGSLLLGYDSRGALRDLYYPQVGLPNHLNGYRNRLGFWIHGLFSWIDDDGWTRRQEYVPGTLIGRSHFENQVLGIEILIEEAVLAESATHVRRLLITNTAAHPKAVKIFSTHDLRIGGHDVGDTAFYHPYSDSIIHYKGPHAFLFSGSAGEQGLDEFTCGTKGFKGFEGTWRDAEDGHLHGQPIAQGSVDSTFGLSTEIAARATDEVWLWMVAGKSIDDVANRLEMYKAAGWDQLLEANKSYWTDWTYRARLAFGGLPDDLQDLAIQSLCIIRSQIDNGGAVIAANDTDILETARATYSYMWPRDGAFVTSVMDRLGYDDLSRRFYRFCAMVLDPARPVLLHKYAPDGSLGASWHPWIIHGHAEIPFQEDESALTLGAFAAWFEKYQDLDFLTEMYEPFIRPMADFLVAYRDPATGLPLPSWDLWEERRGIHAFTVCALIRAMKGCGALARAMGDSRSTTYDTVAEELLAGVRAHFVDPKSGRIFRLLEAELVPDTVVDSSTLAIGLMDILDPHDPIVTATLEAVERELLVKSATGGVARYAGDYYWRVSDDLPGNPWIICTMWLAQLKLKRARTLEDLAEPLVWLEWVAKYAATTGVLAEQIHPETGAPLSVSPLTWSHAEFVQTALDYAEKLKEFGA